MQTVQDALNENIDISREISRTLQIIGLLALLLGGIGIVNTMQVSLSRRRTEIAMLKTAGYRRRDLYALFGSRRPGSASPAGIAGTALGVGISAVVRVLVERVFLLSIIFRIAAGTLSPAWSSARRRRSSSACSPSSAPPRSARRRCSATCRARSPPGPRRRRRASTRSSSSSSPR